MQKGLADLRKTLVKMSQQTVREEYKLDTIASAATNDKEQRKTISSEISRLLDAGRPGDEHNMIFTDNERVSRLLVL